MGGGAKTFLSARGRVVKVPSMLSGHGWRQKWALFILVRRQQDPEDGLNGRGQNVEYSAISTLSSVGV